MKINTKEIFKSDLDPNSPAWWSKDKLDKINYNFYQFINGGMPGPDGAIGPDGDFGPIGMTGTQGPIGDTGYQGTQGISADTDWLYFPHDNETPGYLFPKKINAAAVQYAPIPVMIGIKYNDNYGGINRYTTPLGYGDCVVLSNVNTTASAGAIKSNLRLSHESKIADFKLDENNVLHIGKFINADAGFSIVHEITDSTDLNYPTLLGDNIIKTYRSADSLNYDVHTLDKNNAVISEIQGANAILSNSNSSTIKTESNDSFIYDFNAATNYVLSADDTVGNVSWKNKREVFPSFPIGSIISIRQSDFLNSTYFYLNETITQTPVGGIYPVLDIRWGKGKENTQFSGWYLCNGKTWQPSTSANPLYLVPNLNSFNYSIASNGGGQTLISGTGNNLPVLIGGSDITLNATQSGGVYNIAHTFNVSGNDNGSNIFLGDAGTNHTVERMVHIIFLERSDLIWRDPMTS